MSNVTVNHLRLAHGGGCLCYLLALAGLPVMCAAGRHWYYFGFATTMVGIGLSVAYMLLYCRLYYKAPAEFRKTIEDRERRWRGE
jgi:heme/copper-type cytochrome/quinol oxidase subunit 2